MRFNAMSRTQAYPSLGHCIYCGDDSEPSKLTIEHIIPEALGGRLTFEGASCDKCQRIIERYEGRLLNSMFESARALGNIKGKRKPRSRVNAAEPTSQTTIRRIRIDKDQHLGVVPLFSFPPNQYFHDSKERKSLELTLCLKNIKDWVYNDYEIMFQSDWGVLADFRRMLCKIGHGYWVAEHGEENIKLFLPDIVLNRTEAGMDTFVGSLDCGEVISDDLHEIKTGILDKEGRKFGYVDFSLLSCFPVTTVYRIFVGSIGPDFLEFITPPELMHDSNWKPPASSEIISFKIAPSAEDK